MGGGQDEGAANAVLLTHSWGWGRTGKGEGCPGRCGPRDDPGKSCGRLLPLHTLLSVCLFLSFGISLWDSGDSWHLGWSLGLCVYTTMKVGCCVAVPSLRPVQSGTSTSEGWRGASLDVDSPVPTCGQGKEQACRTRSRTLHSLELPHSRGKRDSVWGRPCSEWVPFLPCLV